MPNPYLDSFSEYGPDSANRATSLPYGCYWVCLPEGETALYSCEGTALFEADPISSRYRYDGGPWHPADPPDTFPTRSDVESYILENDILLNIPVKTWYEKAYPGDGSYSDHSLPSYDTATFKDLYEAVSCGKNIFTVLPNDYSIREKALFELSIRTDFDYSVMENYCISYPGDIDINAFNKDSYSSQIQKERTQDPAVPSPAPAPKSPSRGRY